VKRVLPLFLAGALATSWIAALVGCVRAPVNDADVWWVAVAGRSMLATGSVPRTNGLSFFEPDHPWIMHEWLFGPLYAWGSDTLGPRFFALVAAGAFILTGAIVAGTTLRRARYAATGCAAALVALVLFAHPTARPTWVALAFPGAMAALAFGPRLGRAAAAGCVALELVWTNAHGTFPLGVLLLVAGACAGAVDRPRRIGVAIAAALVTLVNPYGLRLHALVLDYTLGSRAGFDDLHHIIEYAPVWEPRYFTTVAPSAAIALGVLVLISLGGLVRGPHRARAALVLLILPLGLLHARNAPLVAIVACVVLLPAIDDLVARLGIAPYAGPPLQLGPRTVVAAIVGAGSVAAIAFATVASRPSEGWIDPDLGGARFARLAASVPDGGNVVAPFRSAGLLLWLAASRGVRVLYDSRNDCYSPEMRHLGLTLRGLPGDEIVRQLEAHGTTFALVPSPELARPSQRTSYDGALATAAGWSVRAREGDWCLYARAPGP
jgi:hypothetical protein